MLKQGLGFLAILLGTGSADSENLLIPLALLVVGAVLLLDSIERR